ncbi:MAG TPA: RNA methyltransferase [Thermoanaerobaculia bacterium]|nr:RNA methyltransferase [Thermoanaerobaculia bacterium]
MHVRIILVEPREAGNVGAAARAMKNFGITELVIVGPRPPRIDSVSEWWAKGAGDLVQAARHVGSLEEALRDVHLSIATTAVRGRQVYEQLTPAEAAAVAAETLSEEHTLAVVFGREEWGLRGSEIALCQRTASIPTSADFPTMNLAQAVSIFCYELRRSVRPTAKRREPAIGELTHLLNSRTRALLMEVGFFGKNAPDRMCAELQSLAGRAGLTTREASLLLSFVAHVERALHAKHADSSDS